MSVKIWGDCAMFFLKCAMSVPRPQKKKALHRCKAYVTWLLDLGSNQGHTD